MVKETITIPKWQYEEMERQLTALDTLVRDLALTEPVNNDSDYGGACFFCEAEADWNTNGSWECTHAKGCLWVRAMQLTDGIAETGAV